MADTKAIEVTETKGAQHSNGVEGAEPLAEHSNGVVGAEPLAEHSNGVVGAEPLGVLGGNDPLSMIMRQTNYDQATAQQKMLEHNNNIMQVIREYMAPAKPIKVCTTKLSVNQQIYKEIRGMMDDAAKRYELEKAKQQSS